MTPYLSRIERPRGLAMKIVYRLARRQFGKVPPPLAVFMARMPLAFGTFFGKAGSLEKKLMLPPRVRMLVRDQPRCLTGADSARTLTDGSPSASPLKFRCSSMRFQLTGQVRFSPTASGRLSTTRLSLSAINVYNQTPWTACASISANAKSASLPGCARWRTSSTSPISASGSGLTAYVRRLGTLRV